MDVGEAAEVEVVVGDEGVDERGAIIKRGVKGSERECTPKGI